MIRKKTHKVVMLPTEKTSIPHLILGKGSGDLMLYEGAYGKLDEKIYLKQHLYIISDDKIKEGDYGLVNGTQIVKCTHQNTANYWNDRKVPKVVASTDIKITPNYCINKLFIDAYISAYKNNKPITEVDLEREPKIQKLATGEEFMGSELEYNLKIKTREDGSVIIHKVKILTNEEMYLNMQYYYEYVRLNGYVTPQDWIEKHKHF